MKLSLRTMSTEDAAQTIVPSSANYEVFERDVLPNEAFVFLNRLVSPQDMIYLEEPRCSIDFVSGMPLPLSAAMRLLIWAQHNKALQLMAR